MSAPRWTLLGALAIAAATTAHAQETVNPVSTTPVSGFTSSRVTWLAMGEGRMAIAGLSWSESWDKPCWMQIYQRSMHGSTISSSVNPQLALCGMNTGSLETVSFDDNARYYIRGVRVCNNDRNNHRIKGIRIYAAKVWSTREDVDELSASEMEDRPNCDRWDSAVYCHPNHVASAIVVHHNDDEMTGLALRCRRVEWP